MQWRRVVAVVLGGATLLGMLTGCSGAHRQTLTAHETSTGATSAGTVSLDPSASAALAGYEASWTAIDDATRAGNYQLPALSEHLAGHEYLLVTQNLFVYQENGIVSRGAVVLHPHIKTEDLSANPPAVTITDCVDDRSDLLYYKSTGKPMDSVPGGFRADSTVMSELNGVWKATSDNIGADGTCTPE